MQISNHARSSASTTSLLLALVTAALISTARPAQAQLTLTSNGTALGFSLSTFANGFSSVNNIGPLGIAFPSAGGVLATDYLGNARLFPTDTDGQNVASTPVAQNYGNRNILGLAQVGGAIYMSQDNQGSVLQLNPNGTFNQTIVSGLGGAQGIVGNPANGHLFVANANGRIFDVNPIAKTATALVIGFPIDGVSLSSDGKTLYGADIANGHIYGFNTSTGAGVFDSGFIPGGVDGTAVGYGSLTGNLFVNTNGGTLMEISLANSFLPTAIASGGSRGDFVSVDPNNGTLLLTQSDRILRLSGGNFSPVPEASSVISFGLMLLGGCGVFLASRKRKPR